MLKRDQERYVAVCDAVILKWCKTRICFPLVITTQRKKIASIVFKLRIYHFSLQTSL